MARLCLLLYPCANKSPHRPSAADKFQTINILASYECSVHTLEIIVTKHYFMEEEDGRLTLTGDMLPFIIIQTFDYRKQLSFRP